MQPAPPEDYPITGLCIVSEPTKCPPGYEVLLKSQDKRDDCDLWKDGFFRSRVTRYLCITRVFPLDSGRLNNVLADIVIQNEKDVPPDGFSLIDFTVDTREPATRKKQICVKMVPRNSVQTAICDILLLSRAKRPPTGYSLTGEMNGLLICFKTNRVPPETQNDPVQNGVPQAVPPPYSWPQTQQSNSAIASSQASYVNTAPAAPVTNSYNSVPNSHGLSRQGSIIQPTTAMAGIPFQLNARFQDVESLKSVNVPEISYRSFVDIDNEFSYPFRLERSSAARLPPDV